MPDRDLAYYNVGSSGCEQRPRSPRACRIPVKASDLRPTFFLYRKIILKAPKRIESLIEDGLVDEVLRSLMSGKEAQVYLVRCGQEIRCAKVYKDVADRSFKNSV